MMPGLQRLMRATPPCTQLLACLLGLMLCTSAQAQQASTAALRAGLLQNAQRWVDKGRTDVALQMVAKVLAVEPDSPEGLAFAADLALRDNRLDEASQILKTMQQRLPRDAATRELEHVYAIYTLQREKLASMRLMARAGRRSEAAVLARELFPDGAPRYGALGREIAQLTGQRWSANTRLASTPLATAVRPDGVVVTARAKARSGAATVTPTAKAASASAAIAAAKSAAITTETAAAPAASQNPGPEVAPAPRAPSVAELANARAEGLRTVADAELQAGRLEAAQPLLEEAVQISPDDPWLRYDLARLYVRLQQPQRGRQVLGEGLRRQPGDSDMHYAQALLLASLDEDAAALAELQAITPAERSPGMLALAQRLGIQLQLSQAAAAPPARAAQLLQTALLQAPDNADLHLALGNAQQAQGDMAGAQTQADWLQTHLEPGDLYRRLALLRLLQRLGQTQAAHSLATTLLQAYPKDVDVLLHAARLERSEGHYSQALDLFQQAGQRERSAQPPGAAPDAQTLDKIALDIASIEARRQAWVEVGQQTLEKNSTEGLSSLRGWERPVVAWLPWGYEGRLFAHADPVRLDAGSYAGGEPYGQPGSQNIPRGLPQNADGLNVGLGYQGDDWRWDLGETGIGFAVRNWVGGLRYGSQYQNLDYSLELARRPLTGTLLSYAGASDPLTGAVWGGVVSTGVGARLARDIGPYSASLSASYASLTGQNVVDNTRLSWRLAADRDIYSDKTQVLNLGLALSGLEHYKDLSGFTWGHGGYYSPTHNVSLSLPVQWSGRRNAFTWLLKASVSASSSASKASDYYPGNASMQQQSGQIYSGSSSSGSGWAASGAAEYQVSQNLALGAVFAREVSDYYTPLNLMVYARYLFEPVHQALAMRPRPVQPYSQF
jgi:thioredoxin-like negative regulator of GroEL